MSMQIILETPISQKKLSINPDSIVMAIETSCDETCCAIVKDGREVLANVVASQIKTHRLYGGVVPEIAAREHVEAVNMVIEEAFEQSNLSPKEITAFACTIGPGLVGSLLVGLNATKALALAHDKPFVGVNHLHSHICANYIDTDLEPPFISLLVSGGHTQLIKVDSYTDQTIAGETADDAIGEVYDKVARLLGLDYPGGPILDKLAQAGDKTRFKFPEAKMDGYNFSFSGLKSAVLRTIKTFESPPVEDIAASFQEVATQTLLNKTLKLANDNNIKTIALAGGVAANSELRKKFFKLDNYKAYAPPLKYCTDNASMVASGVFFSSDITTDFNAESFSRKSHH